MCNEKPVLSVFLLVYNHEKYLHKALDGILMQKVNFKYEIVVGEDCSQDKSRQILMDYQNMYPDKMNLLFRDKNIGAVKNSYDTFINCQGKYIALLEGDDYWIDDQKLQIQFDFMESHPECSECFHSASVIDDNEVLLSYEAWPYRKSDASNIIELDSSYYIPTASVMLRNVFKDYDYHRSFEITKYIGDRIIHTICLRHGVIKYIDRTMSVYRYCLNSATAFSGKPDLEKAEECVLAALAQKQLVLNEYKAFIQEKIDSYMKHIKLIVEMYERNPNDNLYCCIICFNKTLGFFYHKSEKTSELEILSKYNCVVDHIESHTCPICGCSEKERNIFLYFNKLGIWNEINSSTKVLHLAPNAYVHLGLETRKAITTSGDLHPENFRIKDIQKLDVTCLPFDDNSFDIILCNYVLEYIENDMTAMRELYRVLTPNGKAILQTQYSKDIETTFEDSSISTPSDRYVNFGKESLVRIYSQKDFLNRLSLAGFTLNIVPSRSLFSDEEVEYYGVKREEDLILCTKQPI